MLVARQRGGGQSQYHLFVRCEAQTRQIKVLYKSVGKACGWKHPRAPAVRALFQGERASPAALTFLWGTKVGEMVLLAALGGRRGMGDQAEVEAKKGH